jgi:hypothetical protein
MARTVIRKKSRRPGFKSVVVMKTTKIGVHDTMHPPPENFLSGGTLRMSACKNLQAVPEQASTIGLERPSGGRPDGQQRARTCNVLASRSGIVACTI